MAQFATINRQFVKPSSRLAISRADSHLEREVDRLADCAASAVGGVDLSNVRAAPTDGHATPATGVPHPLAEEILAARGGGTALPAPRQPVPATRFDYSRVRVHHDAAAAAWAGRVNARAFTVGNDIYFGHGEYAPSTRHGSRLLAHELAHVQQHQGRTTLLSRHQKTDTQVGEPVVDEMRGAQVSQIVVGLGNARVLF